MREEERLNLEVKTLTEKVEVLKEMNQIKLDYIDRLKKQNESMTTLCRSITENLDSYKEENYYLTCYISELENDIEELNEENDKLTMTINSIYGKCVDLESSYPNVDDCK